MITRESVLTHAKLVGKICNSRLLTSDMLDALQGLLEYAEQDPDPDAAVWAEIDELQKKLSSHDPVDFWSLVRNEDGTEWLIVKRDRGTSYWKDVDTFFWKSVADIRARLRELATERGLLTPTLEEIMLSLEEMGEDGRAQFSAFVAAQAAKAAKGGG